MRVFFVRSGPNFWNPRRSRAAGCALRTLNLDGNKAGDQPVTVVLKALVRHQPPVSHLGLSDNRLTVKTMQVRSRVKDATPKPRSFTFEWPTGSAHFPKIPLRPTLRCLV